ncbi:acetyl-CoA C-acyltransferase [Biformimicrobium ophioploci]|uniref:Acetyl-CoA C-acetyltransferase n=1 Tax=Biformimicrobium ophioploci TaxID=3036711 RepID=A0ABQ6LXD1_9GAMM|nr:acetyl-CoA C-acyltransferase [Microbulbifer sp. NKW57]GMG86721.1 acetyl-CoA C-acetyltransferase [Microbulbifer sp. NKW57]
MNNVHEVMILDAVRLPRAVAKPEAGAYANYKAVELLKPLYKALEERGDFKASQVDDVLLGCNTQVGDQGANIAKISAMFAGWPDTVPGATINRFCCSGLDAINLGASKIAMGVNSLVVAGGVEHISRVPMFSDKGAWFSDPAVIKSSKFMHMGLSADLIAGMEGYDSETLNEYSLRSHQRAADASKSGRFGRSLVPIKGEQGEAIIASDEGIRPNASMEKLAQLPTAFGKFIDQVKPMVDAFYPGVVFEARHTPANSPALVDGASLVVMASRSFCEEQGLKPRARVISFAEASDEPVRMLTGHIRATEKVLERAGLTADEIDLWEVNESFVAPTLKYQKDFNIPDDKFNVNGGAIAMGHPLGATGGNLVSMLIDELEERGLTKGVVSICGGAGVGVATLIERVEPSE